jgi:hypothetical protein
MSKAKITQDDQQRFAALLGGDLANDPSHVKPIVTVKISGQTAGAITLGADKYVGKMVQNEIAPTDPAWLESDLGDDDDLGFAAEDDCYVLDYAQAGRAADDIVNGNVIGYAPDGRYIVAVSGGGGRVPFWVKITAVEQISTLKRWTYSGTRQEQTASVATTDGGWTDSTTDETSYQCFNSIEAMNGSSGVYGNGVNSANLIGTFDIIPAPVGAIVLVTPVYNQPANTYIHWFQYENAIDGECE